MGTYSPAQRLLAGRKVQRARTIQDRLSDTIPPSEMSFESIVASVPAVHDHEDLERTVIFYAMLICWRESGLNEHSNTVSATA